MEITFLGHAGFSVETSKSIIVMDPWLSPAGAFDSAWFQFPRNHHLAAYVEAKLGDFRKERFLYISHEHKDHLDLAFLSSLRRRDFTVVIPGFRRDHLQTAFAEYECKGVVVCSDGQEVDIPDGSVKLYLDDGELNRDSAILVKAGGRSFLNLNDCRIHDALPGIARTEGALDVFACQYSGAGWHPTCYSYPRETYEAIAAKKVMAKFTNVTEAIRTLQPRVFVPSAGPPCFLDPMLAHLNFERINIFPRAPQLIEHLEHRLRDSPTRSVDLMPGDVLDAGSGELVHQAKERVTPENYEATVRAYADCYDGIFAARERCAREAAGADYVVERLRQALLEKLAPLTLHSRVTTPLYVCLDDLPERMLRVGFPAKEVAYATAVEDGDHYLMATRSSDIARVLDGHITWDDFSLSFRMRLNREPDIYHTILQGFLRLEAEDLEWFCAKLLNIENDQERIVVEAGGRHFAVDRLCPHQGGDLSRAWVEQDRYLVCSRHHWRFDLENEGRACDDDGSIHAMCLDED